MAARGSPANDAPRSALRPTTHAVRSRVTNGAAASTRPSTVLSSPSISSGPGIRIGIGVDTGVSDRPDHDEPASNEMVMHYWVGIDDGDRTGNSGQRCQYSIDYGRKDIIFEWIVEVYHARIGHNHK